MIETSYYEYEYYNIIWGWLVPIDSCLDYFYLSLMVVIQLRSDILLMASKDQLISQALNKIYSGKGEQVKGNSLNNLIITSSHPFIAYSYFDAFIKQNKIIFQLVSVKTNSESDYISASAQQIQFEPMLRVPIRDLDGIQFNIQTNQNIQQLHLLQIKMKRGDDEKSSFFLFYYSIDMIGFDKSLLIKQIIARKNIKKAHWHPSQHNLVVALTLDHLVIFKADEDLDELASISLKQLQIRQQIVDFCFWKQKSIKQSYFMSGLGQTGKTYIMVLKILNQVYSAEVVETLDGLGSLNWTTLNIINAQYNKRQIILSIKSGYIYKNNKKESMMELHQLRKDQRNRYSHQNMIAQVSGKSTSSQFSFPFKQTINSSLFYFYDNKIMKLDLSKPFDFITSNQKGFGHYQIQVQLLTSILHGEQIKFVHISSGSLIVVRSKSKELLFSSFQTDILQCSSRQSVVRNKINQIVASVDKQINNSIPFETIDPLDSLVKPTYLVEQASEASIQKFLTQVNTFVSASQKMIGAEQREIDRLYHQINDLSASFATLTHKKVEVEQLQQQIRQNQLIIRGLQQTDANDHRTYEDEKAQQIKHMIDHVKARPIQVNQPMKKEFSAIIGKQLQMVKGIEEKLREWQKQLNELI